MEEIVETVSIDGIPDYVPHSKHNNALAKRVRWMIEHPIPEWMLPKLHSGNFQALMCGLSGSGKTTVLFHLLVSGLQDLFSRIFIFCPSYFDVEFKTIDKKKVPVTKMSLWHYVDQSVHVFRGYIPKHVEAIVDSLPSDGKHNLFIFDDCIAEEDFKSNSTDNVLNKIAHRGRHQDISTINLTQYYHSMSKQLRSEARYLYLFAGDNMENLEEIKKAVGPTDPDKRKIFLKVINEHLYNIHDWVFYDSYERSWFDGQKFEKITEISRDERESGE